MLVGKERFFESINLYSAYEEKISKAKNQQESDKIWADSGGFTVTEQSDWEHVTIWDTIHIENLVISYPNGSSTHRGRIISILPLAMGLGSTGITIQVVDTDTLETGKITSTRKYFIKNLITIQLNAPSSIKEIPAPNQHEPENRTTKINLEVSHKINGRKPNHVR